jgi:hypothetical protein
MRDERLARAALLALVRGGGEAERARDELDVDVRALCGKLGEQPFEELLVPLACLQRRHISSVLRVSGRTLREERSLEDRSDASMPGFRRFRAPQHASASRARSRSPSNAAS